MSADKRKIEFIDSLPESAIPIITYKDKPLAPIYWFDSEAKRLIKKDGRYRYIRSNKITLLFNNFKTEDNKTKDLISHLLNEPKFVINLS